MLKTALGIFVLLGLCPSLVSTAYSVEPSPGNAGCLLRSDREVVLVRDIWTKRYGLPGGGSDGQHESSAKTAERETLEEVGIVAQATQLLLTTANSFYIYNCEPHGQKIEVLDQNRMIVPREAFNEIGEIILVDPTQIPPHQWRFPEQRQQIIDILPLASSAQKVQLHSVHSTPTFEAEIRWIQKLQSYQNLFWDAFFGLFSFLGGEGFGVLFLPLVWFGIRLRKGLELTFLYSFAVLAHEILKEWFAIPRPFYYLPSLQRQAANGFGFPSGHSLSMALIWIWICLNVNWKGKWWIAFLVALFGGLSRAYWGVHFFHDILGGWAIGALVILSYQELIQFKDISQLPLKVWYLILGALSVFSIFFACHPSVVSLVSFLIGVLITLGPWSNKISRQANSSSSASLKKRMIHFSVVIAGIILIYTGIASIPLPGSFLPCLFMLIFKYLLLGLWMGLAAHFFILKTDKKATLQ